MLYVLYILKSERIIRQTPTGESQHNSRFWYPPLIIHQQKSSKFDKISQELKELYPPFFRHAIAITFPSDSFRIYNNRISDWFLDGGYVQLPQNPIFCTNVRSTDHIIFQSFMDIIFQWMTIVFCVEFKIILLFIIILFIYY